MDLSALTPIATTFKPYHDGVPKRTWQLPADQREFIAWDGEGTNVDGEGKPQHYTLFGSSAEEPLQAETHIHTFDLLDHIIAVGEKHPTAFHVGYSFNYDATQILRSLHEVVIKKIHTDGKVALRRNGARYFIHYLPGKWFSVSRYKQNYNKTTNRHAKTTVRIYDLFSFFGCKFTKAYTDLGGTVSSVVAEGKDARGDFLNRGSEYVLRYWREEIQQLRELAEELRRRMYGAELYIKEWHGPGALATYANNQHKIKQHMAVTPDPVREAARYAYAGGRFEIFQLGRVIGPIYSMDINSAYPHGIRQLPSLANGRWEHVTRPRRLARFGVYRVRMLPRVGGSFLERAPGPLFHRDKMGNISFPWIGEGWYWSPEVRVAARLGKQVEVLEGWEYVDGGAERPYAWVEEMYETRKKWKAEGNASQLALKLCMNSLYGKMAQRVGWNEEQRTAPKWHQLEWAGWTTSNCRAMLWDAMSRISPGKVIAVETDGIYTTQHPATILGPEYGSEPNGGAATGNSGKQHYQDDDRFSSRNREESGMGRHAEHQIPSELHSSSSLGGWEVEVYDEIMYVQSGMAWLRKGDKWICKRRGMDAKTFELDDCRDYLRTLAAAENWPAYHGTVSRFVGMGRALAATTPTRDILGAWITSAREIKPGSNGKRIHVSSQCNACSAGYSAYEAAHDMSIRSLAYKHPMSHPHDIPWENGDLGYEWRKMQND